MDARETAVIAAAKRRADALSAADADLLKDLLHPQFVWTSHKGETFDRESYVSNNTGGELRWRCQHLVDPQVQVTANVAILRATVNDEVELDDQVAQFRMPMTQVWIELDETWLCLAGHAGSRLHD